jgi:hypothetical protein
MFCVRDAVRIGLKKCMRATNINHYVKDAEAGNERRNNLKGKAEQGDNMTQETKREIFEKILVLRGEQERIGQEITRLHMEIVEEGLIEMGIRL